MNMKPLFAKPHLFISYSRKDYRLAEYLYNSLLSTGFSVYYDKEKTLIGENFVAEIVQQLRNSDGVVAIISKHSAESPWCQAELYYTHALGILMAPVRVSQESFNQAAPLDLMLKDINYVIVSDEASYANTARQIQLRLQAVRRKVLIRSLRNVLLLLLVAGLMVLTWKFGFLSLNSVARERQRNDLIERLNGSTSVLSYEVMNSYVKQFSEDEDLISKLLLLENNPELPDAGRLNAHVLATALLAPRKLQNRWYIKDVAWEQSAFEAGELSNVTFMKGMIKDIDFKNDSFSGVVWNAAPSQNAAGLMLSNLKFTMCQFEANHFFGTGAVGLDFINCSFRGTQLDVSGFGAVHFFSQTSDPTSSVITNEISVFERCSIENCVAPAAPGVMEIVPPDSEVRFTGVVFNSCHFRGLIRISWFKDCHFVNCIFPKSLDAQVLQNKSNTLEHCLTAEEECD